MRCHQKLCLFLSMSTIYTMKILKTCLLNCSVLIQAFRASAISYSSIGLKRIETLFKQNHPTDFFKQNISQIFVLLELQRKKIYFDQVLLFSFFSQYYRKDKSCLFRFLRGFTVFLLKM